MEPIGTAARASVAIRLRLVRRFSATLARAFARASRLICRFVDGGYLGGGATLQSVMGDLGRLNTNCCESCGQAEHLNVWRSNATSDVGSACGSTCIRRIEAPQAKHFIAVPAPGYRPCIERQGPHRVKRLQPLGRASLTGRALRVSIAGRYEDCRYVEVGQKRMSILKEIAFSLMIAIWLVGATKLLGYVYSFIF
jgi:hypothetical protein